MGRREEARGLEGPTRYGGPSGAHCHIHDLLELLSFHQKTLTENKELS